MVKIRGTGGLDTISPLDKVVGLRYMKQGLHVVCVASRLLKPRFPKPVIIAVQAKVLSNLM